MNFRSCMQILGEFPGDSWQFDKFFVEPREYPSGAGAYEVFELPANSPASTKVAQFTLASATAGQGWSGGL